MPSVSSDNCAWETSTHLCSVPLPNMILGRVKTRVTCGLLHLDIMNFFTIMWIQRKMEVRVWGKKLIGNTNPLSLEKRKKKTGAGEDKDEEVEEEKEWRRGCRKKPQTLEGSIIQKWESCDLETLNLTRCIKAMQEKEEAKPDKRAASRKNREMGWWAGDVTKEIVLETSHQQIHETMAPSWAKHTITGIMLCDTLSFILSVCYEP